MREAIAESALESFESASPMKRRRAALSSPDNP
jgi:hypothetical protein